MAQPPRDEDPTSEEPALEFDGADTQPIEDTSRFRVVTASESDNGTVGFDDRGHALWKWRTELPATAVEGTGTFDQLKALDNPALSLEGDAGAAKPEPARKVGYDPYATGVFEKPKLRR